jgi:hypothetical protein
MCATEMRVQQTNEGMPTMALKQRQCAPHTAIFSQTFFDFSDNDMINNISKIAHEKTMIMPIFENS